MRSSFLLLEPYIRRKSKVRATKQTNKHRVDKSEVAGSMLATDITLSWLLRNFW